MLTTQEKITSPEQLNDYIRVTSPGAWLILSAILIFLAGFFFWIFNGQLEISFPTYIYTEGASSSAFVDVNDAVKLKRGMTVRLAESGVSGTVENVSAKVLSQSEISQLIGEDDALALGILAGSKRVKVAVKFPELVSKISPAVFIIEQVKPVSFLLK